MTMFRIVPERSLLWAEARSSLHPIRVETAGLEGFFEVAMTDHGPDLRVQPTGRIEIDAELLKTGSFLHDRELTQRLEIKTYPRVRGEVVEVQELGADGRYRVRGNLSFHGVTRPVEGDVQLRVADDGTVEVEGEQVIDMRDFGLEPPRLLMLRVYPEVRVRGHVVARREE